MQACASGTYLAPLVSTDTRRLLMRGASALETLGHQARADWLDIMAEQVFFALREGASIPWRLLDAGRISSAAKHLHRHDPHYAELVLQLQLLADAVATAAVGFPVELHSFAGVQS